MGWISAGMGSSPPWDGSKTVDDVEAERIPIGTINPRDYRFVMKLARRYNAIVFWHRDRNGVDWQPLLMPLRRSRKRGGTR